MNATLYYRLVFLYKCYYGRKGSLPLVNTGSALVSFPLLQGLSTEEKKNGMNTIAGVLSDKNKNVYHNSFRSDDFS